MNARHWTVLVGAAAMLGSAFSFTSLALAHMPPLSVAAGRAAVAALALWAILPFAGKRLPAGATEWRPLVVLGVMAGAVPFAALAWGQVRVQSSVAGILFGTLPMFTLLCSHFQTRDERMTRARLAGIALGLAGVALVVGPAAVADLGGDLGGQALILFAALSFGFSSVYARRHVRSSPLVVSAAQTLCAAAILVPVCLALDRPWQISPGGEALAALAGLGLIGTAVPAPGVFWLIRSVGATSASLLAYFVPVAAVAVGVLALRETLGAAVLGGFALILAGAMLVSRRSPEPAPATSL